MFVMQLKIGINHKIQSEINQFSVSHLTKPALIFIF